LAAAEACWEGLLGLPPVKRMRISIFSRRARWERILRYLAVAYPWWSWWWQTLSIVGVVFVGTVAGEVVVAGRRVKKFARGRRNSLQSHNQTTEIARTWRSASGIQPKLKINSQRSRIHRYTCSSNTITCTSPFLCTPCGGSSDTCFCFSTPILHFRLLTCHE
jgi:hypothetical protein